MTTTNKLKQQKTLKPVLTKELADYDNLLTELPEWVEAIEARLIKDQLPFVGIDASGGECKALHPYCWTFATNFTKVSKNHKSRPIFGNRLASPRKGHSKLKGETVARLTYRIYFLNGERIKDNQSTNHQCQSHKCVNPYHLRLLTQKENMKDRIKHGTSRPWNNKRATTLKFSKQDILDIRTQFACGIRKQTELAAIYNCSSTLIGAIVHGKQYKQEESMHLIVPTNKKKPVTRTKKQIKMVREIRKLYDEQNLSAVKLAKMFDCSPALALQIANREIYKDIV